MLNTQHGNYVKFIRGTENAWSKIIEKNSDTLYFISNVDGISGRLYLGNKLIANGGLSSASSLETLNDVSIENITDQSILVFNQSTGLWENKSILDLPSISNSVFEGATEESDGIKGLVPAPIKGEQAFYLRGDGIWANPTEQVESDIGNLQTNYAVLIGTDTGKSIREIASDEATTAIATIIDEAPEQFDTLKEIAEWIQDNQGSIDVAGLTTKVTNLEEIIYGKEATEETEAVIGLQTIVSDNTNRISSLEENMKWQDISVEEENV